MQLGVLKGDGEAEARTADCPSPCRVGTPEPVEDPSGFR